MFKKFKDFCEREWRALSWGGNPQKALSRAYGAMMFCFTFCSDEDYKLISEYWEEDFRKRF